MRSVIITSNEPEYRAALIEWMVRFGKNIHETVRFQSRLLGERLISFTPPKTHAQGVKRVQKDIAKIILGVENNYWLEKATLVDKGDPNIVRAFVDKHGVVYGVDREMFKPEATIADLDKFHQSQRNHRGRVGEAGQETRNIGRWKFITMMIAPKSRVEEYIQLVSDRVGRARGGWASGTQKLGGKVAGWVAIHARSAGTFIDKTEDLNPSFEFINKSEWAGGDDTERVMRNAVESRIKAIQSSIIADLKKAGKPLKHE